MMASNSDSAAPKLRWLRAMIAAMAAEVILMCIAVPVYATMPQANATALLSLIVPPASFVIFVVAGYWSAKAVPGAAVLQGALAGVVALIPRIPLPERRPRLKGELAIYRDRQVWLSIGVTALAAGGVFCAFSYLAPLLTDVAGLADGWVPTVLALFGRADLAADATVDPDGSGFRGVTLSITCSSISDTLMAPLPSPLANVPWMP